MEHHPQDTSPATRRSANRHIHDTIRRNDPRIWAKWAHIRGGSEPSSMQRNKQAGHILEKLIVTQALEVHSSYLHLCVDVLRSRFTRISDFPLRTTYPAHLILQFTTLSTFLPTLSLIMRLLSSLRTLFPTPPQSLCHPKGDGLSFHRTTRKARSYPELRRVTSLRKGDRRLRCSLLHCSFGALYLLIYLLLSNSPLTRLHFWLLRPSDHRIFPVMTDFL